MPDREDAEVVEDLDDGRTVHFTSRNRGADVAVHLDEDCRHIEDVAPTFSKATRLLTQARPVCQECTGNASFGQEKGVDVNATRDELLSMNPDDAGLSALGDRHSRQDGGHDA